MGEAEGELLRWRLTAADLAAAGAPRAALASAAVEQLAAAIGYRAALARAVTTARRAAQALGEGHDELTQARIWSLLDVFTRWGRLADLFEHDRVNRSSDDLGRARFLLGQLRRHLAEIQDAGSTLTEGACGQGDLDPRAVPANPHGTQVGEGWRWADVWLGDPISEIVVDHRIGAGRAEVVRTRRALAELLTRLERHQAEAGWRLESLREQVRRQLT